MPYTSDLVTVLEHTEELTIHIVVTIDKKSRNHRHLEDLLDKGYKIIDKFDDGSSNKKIYFIMEKIINYPTEESLYHV